MTERPTASQKPNLLTAEQITDPKYLEFVRNSSEIQERTDFAEQAYPLFEQQHPVELLSEINLSSGLQLLLERERPAAIFVDPEDLAKVLPTPDNLLPTSDICVTYRPKEVKGSLATIKYDYEEWVIELNGIKHDRSKDRNSVGVVLTRGQVPIRQKEEPFLVVKYFASYGDGKITFVPEIKPTDDGGVIGDKLQQLLRDLLGIEGKTIDQELNLTVGEDSVYVDMTIHDLINIEDKTIDGLKIRTNKTITYRS